MHNSQNSQRPLRNGGALCEEGGEPALAPALLLIPWEILGEALGLSELLFYNSYLEKTEEIMDVRGHWALVSYSE